MRRKTNRTTNGSAVYGLNSLARFRPTRSPSLNASLGSRQLSQLGAQAVETVEGDPVIGSALCAGAEVTVQIRHGAFKRRSRGFEPTCSWFSGIGFHLNAQ